MKIKRIFAWIMLILFAILTGLMIYAALLGESGQKLFIATMFVIVFLAVQCFAIFQFFRITKKSEEKKRLKQENGSKKQ